MAIADDIEARLAGVAATTTTLSDKASVDMQAKLRIAVDRSVAGVQAIALGLNAKRQTRIVMSDLKQAHDFLCVASLAVSDALEIVSTELRSVPEAAK